MIRLSRLWLLLLLALIASGPVSTAPANDPHLIVSNAWVRPTAMNEDGHHGSNSAGDYGPTAAYMELTNNSDMALHLVGAASPVAGAVEFHETTIENEVMRMRPVDALEIPAGESVVMAPGGLHLMLLDLERDLLPGVAISMILAFEALAGDQTEPFQVIIGVPVLDESPQNPAEIVMWSAWARPTAMAAMHSDHENDSGPDMIPPSAAYMTITNTGDEDRTIVSASSDLAGVVELHNTLLMDDVMQMFELEDGLLLPAGETVELRPRGMHVMLMQLARDLVPGDALFLVLDLDNGETITLGVPVRDELDMMPD